MGRRCGWVPARSSPASSLRLALALALALAVPATAPDPAADIAFAVNWPEFLGRSDVTSRWSRPSPDEPWAAPGPPFSYDTAAFLGNGNVGAMVQATPDGSVALVLGRTDAYDRRVPGSPFAVDDLLCDVAKLPIGNLTLHTAGRVLSASTRMRLWDGEVTVELNTTAGRISARLLAFGGGSAPSAGGSGIIVASSNSSDGEARARWRFTAANASANTPHPVYKTEVRADECQRMPKTPHLISKRSEALTYFGLLKLDFAFVMQPCPLRAAKKEERPTRRPNPPQLPALDAGVVFVASCRATLAATKTTRRTHRPSRTARAT